MQGSHTGRLFAGIYPTRCSFGRRMHLISGTQVQFFPFFSTIDKSVWQRISIRHGVSISLILIAVSMISGKMVSFTTVEKTRPYLTNKSYKTLFDFFFSLLLDVLQCCRTINLRLVKCEAS